ncbi:MAG: hypothetical protein IT439_02090 [Phycisphaerales bacterium]|nr:hypothetical protein [Phycisphaerales bacterium]
MSPKGAHPGPSARGVPPALDAPPAWTIDLRVRIADVRSLDRRAPSAPGELEVSWADGRPARARVLAAGRRLDLDLPDFGATEPVVEPAPRGWTTVRLAPDALLLFDGRAMLRYLRLPVLEALGPGRWGIVGAAARFSSI